jgi:adenosylcobinamide-GDP ribazoletransferase
LPAVVRAFQALSLAGRFLTRWPFPAPADAPPTLYGDAAPFYPVIGLLLGCVLAALAAAGLWLGLTAMPVAGVLAVVLLGVWVWSTGALHLDGLTDCADAWVGGIGSRQRSFEILKDPHVGAMGVVALILVLLAKLSSLWAMLVLAGAPGASALITLLVWVPALARAQILWLALTTQPARLQGLGAVLGAQLPRRAAWTLALLGTLIPLLGIASLSLAAAVTVAGVTALVVHRWRRALLHRLGGYTGDGVGALVELVETAALLAAMLVIPGGATSAVS